MDHAIKANFQCELAEIEAESLRWTLLVSWVYLSDDNAAELLVVGLVRADRQTDKLLRVY